METHHLQIICRWVFPGKPCFFYTSMLYNLPHKKSDPSPIQISDCTVVCSWCFNSSAFRSRSGASNAARSLRSSAERDKLDAAMAQPRTRSWEKVVRMHLGLGPGTCGWKNGKKNLWRSGIFYGLEKRQMVAKHSANETWQNSTSQNMAVFNSKIIYNWGHAIAIFAYQPSFAGPNNSPQWTPMDWPNGRSSSAKSRWQAGKSQKWSHKVEVLSIEAEWCPNHQWSFQDPKMEVPTIYKAYVRPM